MSRSAKRFRSLVITVIAVAATNYAISFAGIAKTAVPTIPDAPRPKTAVPTIPDAPRPKTAVPTIPDAPRPKTAVPTIPDAPRP